MTSVSTQSRVPGAYLYFSSGVPTSASVATNVESAMQYPPSVEGHIIYSYDLVASTNGLANIVAPSKGRFRAIRFANGATATDGTNSWEILLINKSNSNAVLLNAGFGAGTNAASASVSDAATAAYGTEELLSAETTAYVNEGDNCLLTWTEDGSPGEASIHIMFEPSHKGR